MGVNGKIEKSAIGKRLALEKKRTKFGTRGAVNYTCRALFVSYSLSSVLDNSVHVETFQLLNISRGYSSLSFYPISSKLNGKYVVRGLDRPLVHPPPHNLTSWYFSEPLLCLVYEMDI